MWTKNNKGEKGCNYRIVSHWDKIPIWCGSKKVNDIHEMRLLFLFMFLWIRGRYDEIDILRELETITNTYNDEVNAEWPMDNIMPPVLLHKYVQSLFVN